MPPNLPLMSPSPIQALPFFGHNNQLNSTQLTSGYNSSFVHPSILQQQKLTTVSTMKI